MSRPISMNDAIRCAVIAERERLGLSQADLANRMLVTRQCLNRYERAGSGLGLRSLERMSNGLGIKLSELIQKAERLLNA